MPQLDVYIICNMLFWVITMFIFTYMLNINNILLQINLLVRLRKLKISLDKKYISKILKESLFNLTLCIYIYTCNLSILILKKIKDHYLIKNVIDQSNLKKFLYVLQNK